MVSISACLQFEAFMFAVPYIDRGTPPQLVQATLGHESLSTTGKYAHARPNQSSGLDLPG
ncbi:MAG: hypothetical protein KME22_11320 [Hassallia sp. WJT32-NPBG1]|nr:hypothetical protein [Hassallia sp. WJT32-NPBG1]